MPRRATQVPVKAKRRSGTRSGRPGAMSERQLSRAVVELATRLGWMVHTLSDSRSLRSHHPGWPDLFMVRGVRALAVELKAERGRMREGQQGWLDALRGADIEVCVWRPADWHSGEVECVLRFGG